MGNVPGSGELPPSITPAPGVPAADLAALVPDTERHIPPPSQFGAPPLTSTEAINLGNTLGAVQTREGTGEAIVNLAQTPSDTPVEIQADAKGISENANNAQVDSNAQSSTDAEASPPPTTTGSEGSAQGSASITTQQDVPRGENGDTMGETAPGSTTAPALVGSAESNTADGIHRPNGSGKEGESETGGGTPPVVPENTPTGGEQSPEAAPDGATPTQEASKPLDLQQLQNEIAAASGADKEIARMEKTIKQLELDKKGFLKEQEQEKLNRLKAQLNEKATLQLVEKNPEMAEFLAKAEGLPNAEALRERIEANIARQDLEEKIRNKRQGAMDELAKKIQNEKDENAETVAKLHEEDLRRMKDRVTYEALLGLIRVEPKHAETLAKQENYDLKQMREKVAMELLLNETEEQKLNKKSGGAFSKTRREELEEYAKAVDKWSKFSASSESAEKKAISSDALEKLQNQTGYEVYQAVLEKASPEGKKLLLEKVALYDEKGERITNVDAASAHIHRQLQKIAEDNKDPDNKKKKKDALKTKPTWRGAREQLLADRSTIKEAKEKLKMLRDPQNPAYGNLDRNSDLYKNLVKEQEDIIKAAKIESKLVMKYMLGLVGKRAFWIWLFLNAAIFIGGPLLMSNIAGKLLGASK